MRPRASAGSVLGTAALALALAALPYAGQAQVPAPAGSDPAPAAAESDDPDAMPASTEAAADEAAAQPNGATNAVPAQPTEAGAVESTPASPYQSIVTRNPFGLKPIPPPPPAPDPTQQAVVPSNLKLTGYTTQLGAKRAMFTVMDGKTNLVSDLVREGDWDTVITNLQVLNIDEKAGIVRVAYGGKEMSLDFANNGIKPPVAPGAPPPNPAGARPIPTISGVQPQAAAAYNNSFNAETIRQIPPRPSRVARDSAASAVAMPVLATPEQQVLLFQEQKRLADQMGIQLPPSPVAPGTTPGEGGTPRTAPPGTSPPPLPPSP